MRQQIVENRAIYWNAERGLQDEYPTKSGHQSTGLDPASQEGIHIEGAALQKHWLSVSDHVSGMHPFAHTWMLLRRAMDRRRTNVSASHIESFCNQGGCNLEDTSGSFARSIWHNDSLLCLVSSIIVPKA
ncbi:hypothetical protein Vi05172_g5009 [Venturia inaequalis]|nr:hypothetical protein Vi05172_g5009 [Venturia inaequalis]